MKDNEEKEDIFRICMSACWSVAIAIINLMFYLVGSIAAFYICLMLFPTSSMTHALITVLSILQPLMKVVCIFLIAVVLFFVFWILSLAFKGLFAMMNKTKAKRKAKMLQHKEELVSEIVNRLRRRK